MTSYLPAKVLATGVLQVGDLIFFAYITELWIRTTKVYGRKNVCNSKAKILQYSECFAGANDIGQFELYHFIVGELLPDISM